MAACLGNDPIFESVSLLSLLSSEQSPLTCLLRWFMLQPQALGRQLSDMSYFPDINVCGP